MKIKSTIRELPKTWLWKERGTTYKTAHSAMKAMQREARQIVKSRPDIRFVIRNVDWEPTTDIGRAIVKTLLA